MIKLNEREYFKEIYKKTQIVLHHTVSGGDTDSTIRWWNQTHERVATAIIVERSGVFNIVFDEKYYSNHLGLSNSHFIANSLKYQPLCKTSIGIELCNWGPLAYDKKTDKFYPVKVENGKIFPNTTCASVEVRDIIEFKSCANGFRGFWYFEKYTGAQIDMLFHVLFRLCKEHNIPRKFTNAFSQNVSIEALKGTPGIYSHASYRIDKTDVSPQPELIKMLKSL